MAKVLPGNLMNSVLGKLYDILCSGDETVPPSEDNYLAWITPGIPYPEDELDFLHEGMGGVYKKVKGFETDQNEKRERDSENGEVVDEDTSIEELNRMMADEARAKYIHAENLARICDLIPDTSGTGPISSFNVWNAEMTMSNAYDQILRFSKVADVEPDERTKKKLAKLRSLLETKRIEVDFLTDEEKVVIEPSPIVQRYEQYLTEWESAKLAYNAARIEAIAGTDERAVHNFTINGPILRRRVSAAMNKWNALGYKNQFERISAFISQVEGRSIALLKGQYLRLFNAGQLNSILTGLPFWPSMLIPGGFAKSTNGWTEFKFDSYDYRAKYDYSKKKGTGGASFGFGLFKAKAKVGYEKEEHDHKIDTSRFSLRFKIAQTPIIRPAFNFQFLTSQYWKFDENVPDFGSQMVSDGKRPAKGMMPAYSTTCIWVKDLELRFGESHYGYESIKKYISGRAGFGWGPFSIGGNYSQDNFSRDIEASGDSQSIKVKGMQLIGFKCHMLPKTPNPNKSIEHWV